MTISHPTNRTLLTGELPRSVAIVGLGPSQSDYFRNLTQHQPELQFDEVWSVNTGLRYTPHDLAWVMDDLRDYADRFPAYGDALREHHRPIMTNTAYPEFPAAVSYPLDAVLEACPRMKRCFYGNSMPYLFAYAAALGVTQLWLFGVDYSYPGMDAREQGREVAAAWIGYLRGRGMEVLITDGSSMLQSHRVGDPDFRPFYGYLRQPAVPGVTR